MVAVTIAISQGKGGVAKTTTSINLAGALLEKGYKTMVCDWDLEKPDAHRWIKKNENNNHWVCLVDKENAVAQVKALKEAYDILIFDTPPNYEASAFKAVMASDFVIIPTSNNFLDQENAQDATSLPMLAKKPFKLLMSKVKKATKDYKSLSEQVNLESICFKTVITDRTIMAQCPGLGSWIGEVAKNKDNHIQFQSLADEVIEWTSPTCHTCGINKEALTS